MRYNGTADTLTIRNTNGANATKASAPFGGSIVLATEVDVTVTVKDVTDSSNIQNARVFMQTDPGNVTIIDKALTNASGEVTATFDYTADQAVDGTVRKGSTSTAYATAAIGATITSGGLDLTVQLVPDE